MRYVPKFCRPTIEHSVVGRDEDLDDMLSAQILRQTYPIMDVVRGL